MLWSRRDSIVGAAVRPVARSRVAGGTHPARARPPSYLLVLLAVAGLSALQACATPTRLPAVPEDREADATLGGMTGVRYWQEGDLALMQRDGIESVMREAALLGVDPREQQLPPADFLAISGGGEVGACGSGLLIGWTAAGTRPEFKLVTGVSTGALTAPFAFLGPAYDAQLREVYTGTSADDVLKKRNILAAIFDDALADNAPLRGLIAKYVTPEMLEAIAAEHARGRILLIGTTNLDARKPVIWNIGKIAASGAPGALELVRKILIASSAIPAAFPPMMIDVTVDGAAHQEMHVDGGASAQVFVYPPSLDVRDLADEQHISRERRVYVIRNARLDPDWADTERETMSIAGRAVSSLIQSQGVGDLYRIYQIAERDGVDFNLAYIPESFNLTLSEPFDTSYMNGLFELGFELGSQGYPWRKAPPGFETHGMQAAGAGG